MASEKVRCPDGHDHDKKYISNHDSGQYKALWTEFKLPSTKVFLKFTWDKLKQKIPNTQVLDRELPVTHPKSEDLEFKDTEKGILVTWLGHACVLVQMDGVRILTDPVFSDKCGPALGFQMGPTRYRPAPCALKELPTIDAVVISHNHYDHLDLQTVHDINNNTNFRNVEWFVPVGLKGWMMSSGCKNVEEMDWWQKRSMKEKPSVNITFVPAQHWSGRKAFDYNKSLWGGWCIQSGPHSFYFAGDTGYDEGLFKEIGKLGPFDLAAIPIGAYEPRDCMKAQHIDPEQAFQIHEHIKARKSIGIHWGTFHLSNEPYLEPKQRIEKLQEGKQNEKGEYDFFTVNPGDSKFIEYPPHDPPTVDSEHS